MSRTRVRVWIGGAALLAMTLISYIPALSGGYVWDDDRLLTNNPNIRTLAGLVRTWTDPRANTDYYPLTHSSWWLEYHLFGLNAFVFHLDNVLLHIGTGFVFWLLLRLLMVPGAWVAAAVFLVHPLHVESVAWVSERKNVLSGLLCLLAVWSFLRSALDESGPAIRRWTFSGLSLLFFVCALLAKPVTMAAAAVLPLLIWWKRGRLTRGDALAVVPYFAVAAPMAALTIWVQYHHVGASGESFDLSLPQRTILAGRALLFYAGKLAWPQGLTFAYTKWALDASLPRNYLYPAGAAVAVIAAAGATRRFGRGPLVAVCAFALMLSPALGFVNIYWHRFYFVADHICYLAGLSLIALAAATAATCVTFFGPRGRQAAHSTAAILVGVLGILTWRQGGIYKDAETIWRDTLRKSPTSWLANINLGIVLARQGRDQEAIRQYMEALRTYPDYDKAHNNLGILLMGQNRSEEATRHFQEALRINPDYTEARYNLALALEAMGLPEEADRQYRQALGLAPR